MSQRFGVYEVSKEKNRIGDMSITVCSLHDALTVVKEEYGTNTGIIRHFEETQTEYEHWIVPVNEKQIMIAKY